MRHALVLLFPMLVAVLGVFMVVLHRRGWNTLCRRPMDQAEIDFQVRRFKRRTRASALLAFNGFAMLAGLNVDPREAPRVYIGLWALVVLVTFWIGLLALVDAAASGRRVAALRRGRLTVRAELEAEAHRLRALARQESTPSSESTVVS
jgi:hypothetical protein